MKKFKGLTWIIVVVLFFGGSVIKSDDGMWMPHQMMSLNLQKMGLEMNPADLYKKDGTGLMSAVVSLGGGTGEFVSKKGLILTNHHVAFGAIQRASDKKHDYIKNGFLAMKDGEEIPAQGYIADVLLGYEDITKQIYKKMGKKLKPYEKYKKLDAFKKKIIKKAESKGSDLRCYIRSMYSGNQYYLFTFKRLKDIRLVYAPPKSLGNFGGDIDNWMWPRHTCDFTYLRAYVSKKNIGTAYSKDNVPYRPKSVLTLSTKGVKDGDFSFIMGYPGRTYRNYTAAEFKSNIEGLKKRLNQFRDIINFYEKAGKDDRGIQIKYAGKIKGLNNALKNYTGKLEGFESRDISGKKDKEENEFLKSIKDTELQKKAVAHLKKIENFVKKNKKFGDKYAFVNGLKNSFFGSTIMAQAFTVYKSAVESQKSDSKRDRGFQKRDLPRLKQGIKLAERGYHFDTDRAFFKHLIKQNLKKEGILVPATLQGAFKKGVDGINALVDQAYQNTILKDSAKRVALLNKSPKALLKTKDIFIKIASEIINLTKDFDKKSKAMNQEFTDIKKEYMAIALKYKQGFAPDANSSIRFTSGIIDGYYPKDALWYKSKTSLTGIIDKDTGKTPFNVPKKLKELYNKKDFGNYTDKELNDIPACFLNTTNVTGGNSGSPTLNARGEQTGIIFDMTYESVTGDYYIIPELQRTISVDIRFVLFITEKFSNAGYLLKEMVIK